jgi:DNA helicase HerA-like ATPase
LRAYTPRDQKAVQAAATTFRPNPSFSTEKAITELGKGEALVSVLDLKGVPTMVERTMIRPPSGRMGPITPAERKAAMSNSPVFGEYDKTVDRESAYEKLTARAKDRAGDEAKAQAQKDAAKDAARSERAAPQRETATERFVKNMASTVGRQVGTIVVRSLVRGILGGLSRSR